MTLPPFFILSRLIVSQIDYCCHRLVIDDTRQPHFHSGHYWLQIQIQFQPDYWQVSHFRLIVFIYLLAHSFFCFILDESNNHKVNNSNDPDDNQRYLTLDIVSSQSRVLVSVDGAVVYLIPN